MIKHITRQSAWPTACQFEATDRRQAAHHITSDSRSKTVDFRDMLKTHGSLALLAAQSSSLEASSLCGRFSRKTRTSARARIGPPQIREPIQNLLMSIPSATATRPISIPRRAEGRFYTGMAIIAIGTAIAGFVPALVGHGLREAPLTLAVAVHGLICASWLLLFLVQTLLVGKGRIAVHRRLGYVGALLAVCLVAIESAADWLAFLVKELRMETANGR
jgi:hypothetical protein